MNILRKKQIKIKPKQIWQDNDPRPGGRLIIIDEIESNVAYCRSAHSIELSTARKILEAGGGRKTTIKLSRFGLKRSTSYTLCD